MTSFGHFESLENSLFVVNWQFICVNHSENEQNFAEKTDKGHIFLDVNVRVHKTVKFRDATNLFLNMNI